LRELWKWSIFLYGRSVRGTWRGGPCRISEGRLWKLASLSTGALSGNLEGCSFTGDFERRMKAGSRGV